MIKRALISVSDKAGAAGFAKRLSALGVEIISTGGTAGAIKDAGVKAIEVQDLTGFPECLGGRVKTLHPKIHGGLLAVRSDESHMAQMRENGVGMIDLVAVNLYPFKRTVEKPGVTLEEAIENIDIGGPAMLRSAAKNFRDVTVIVDPSDYDAILEILESGRDIPADIKFKLARKAFEHTAAYDALIAGYLGRVSPFDGSANIAGRAAGANLGGAGVTSVADVGNAVSANIAGAPYFPQKLTLTYEIKQHMRYGENPHQSAAFYTDPSPNEGSLATYAQLHGKELSYNNIGDLDGALSLLAEFDEPAIVAVKHANPCGAAVAGNLYDAYLKAYESDTVSIYGGIVAANREIDVKTASEIRKIFLEIVAAPGYSEEALKILKRKKNIRLLVIDTPAAASSRSDRETFIKKVGGGLLVQTSDNTVFDMDNLSVPTERRPTEKELSDLRFAMQVVKHTKSNAIALVKDNATVGVGPGQNSRIMSAKIAIEIAGERSVGSVAASEALFPFDDCVEAFAAAGVTAVIQPGGGVNDAASIEACNRHGMTMVFTGVRHFKH